jgi:arsenite oxidase small subunit
VLSILYVVGSPSTLLLLGRRASPHRDRPVGGGECFYPGNLHRLISLLFRKTSLPDTKKISKAQALESFRRLQVYTCVLFFLSASFGVYLLATDKSLWILAVSHAYGLVAVVAIDGVFGLFNLLSVRQAYLPSMAWAGLTFFLQLGDILTAPQYGMTMIYFAKYLFGLWAFDALLGVQIVIIIVVLSGRSYLRALARKKRITYFDMGIKNSRRDFLQIGGSIIALVGLAGILGAFEALTSPSQSSPTTQTANTSNLPQGAIANVNQMQPMTPVYFDYPSSGYPNMLLKKSDGSLVALSLLCTHVCCQCSYNSYSNQIQCPCHGSVFDGESGRVLNGPASLPLPSIQLSVDSAGNVFPESVKGSSPCLQG